MIGRIVLLVASFFFVTSVVSAQVDAGSSADQLSSAPLAVDSIPWKYKAIGGVGFDATTLSNWMGGGQSSVGFRFLFLGVLDYSHETFSWENDLDLGYSITKLGDQDFRKADDKIIYTTKASLKQEDWFRYTAYVDFRTQFYTGYNYDVIDSTSPSGFLKISDFFAPAFLTASIGAEWTPVPEFNFLVSPIASRSTFVLVDDLPDGSFGVPVGQRSLTDLGAVINATVEWEIVENVLWKARLNGFGRYEAFDKWVLTLENAFILKVNSFLSVGILTDVFYDERVPVLRDNGTIGPATQFRNQITLNLTHTFTNY